MLSAELKDTKYQGESKPLLTVVNILGNMKSKQMVGDKRNVNRSNTEMKRSSVAPIKRPKTATFAPNTKPVRP